MNQDNYRPCAPRLSQGDIVRAPIGQFVGLRDIADLAGLDSDGPALPYGDLGGIAMSVPRLRTPHTTVLRAWYLPAIVVTPDCDIDKDAEQILLAPIFPLRSYEEGTRHALRAGEYVSAFMLPAEPAMQTSDGTVFPFPESVVELGQTTTVAPSLTAAQRMVSLGETQIDRLHEAWIRFVALKEISSTGTVSAAVNQRIAKVAVVESSKKRHTVVLLLDNGSALVLYQEPRRKGPQVASIKVSKGEFTPREVCALIGSDLVLRFENDDARTWDITCGELSLPVRTLKAAGTTEVLIRCPDQPARTAILNTNKRTCKIHVEVASEMGQLSTST